MIKNLLYISIVLALLLSCNPDEEVVVSPELQPYFDLFQEEGRKRGINVDYDVIQIEGRIADLIDSNVNGWCSFNDEKPHEIIIHDSYWAEADEFDKEFILMHELGHCYLNRLHDDSVDGNGNCLSIMHASTETCIFPYDEETRDAYLDELFK